MALSEAPDDYAATDAGCRLFSLADFLLRDADGAVLDFDKLTAGPREVRLEGHIIKPPPAWWHLGGAPFRTVVGDGDGAEGDDDVHEVPADLLAQFDEKEPRVGQYIDAFCPQTLKWFEAKVLKRTETQIRVHFKGWKAKYDETLDIGSYRIGPHLAMIGLQRAVKAGKAVRIPDSIASPRAVSITGEADLCFDYSGGAEALWLTMGDDWFKVCGVSTPCVPQRSYVLPFEASALLFWLSAATVRALSDASERNANTAFWRVVRGVLSQLEELSEFRAATERAAKATEDANELLEELFAEDEDGAEPRKALTNRAAALLARLRGPKAANHVERLLHKHSAFILQQLEGVDHPRAGEAADAGAAPPRAEAPKPEPAPEAAGAPEEGVPPTRG